MVVKTILTVDAKVMQDNNYAGVPVLMKLQAACIFNKKRLQHRCFPLYFAKILRTLILQNVYEGLLLRLVLLCVNKNAIFDPDKKKKQIRKTL